MPGSFAALIPRGVWNMDSPNFALTAFSEVRIKGVLGSCVALGSHQAAHHPYHQLHGPILAQLLLAYQCAPRLKVLG
jgi:hypothetical protein